MTKESIICFLLVLTLFVIPTSLSDEHLSPIIITEGITNGEIIEESIWYQIELNGNYEFTLIGSNSSTDFDMVLYSSTMQAIESAFAATYPDIFQVYSYYETCYLEIIPFQGKGQFTLNVSHFPVRSGDHERNPIQLISNTYNGNVIAPGELWFQTNLTDNTNIRLEADENSDFDLVVYSLNLEIVDSVTFGKYPRQVTFYAMNMTVLILIRSQVDIGSFTLLIEQLNKTPGDHPRNPIYVEEGHYEGEMPGVSEFQSNWYQILCNGTYRFALQGSDLSDFDMRLYDSSGNQIESSSRLTYPEVLIAEALFGNYSLEIHAYEGSGWYTLDIDELTHQLGHSPDFPLEIGPGIVNGILPGPALDGSIWYQIHLFGNYSISLDHSPDDDYDLIVYDELLITVDTLNSIDVPDITELTLLNGTYYLNLLIYRGSWGEYSLEIIEISEYAPTEDPLASGRRESQGSYVFTIIQSIIGLIIVSGLIMRFVQYYQKRTLGKKKISWANYEQNVRSKVGYICPSCETYNTSDAIFCTDCGTSLI